MNEAPPPKDTMNTFKPLQITPHSSMVQIPLEEYRRYIESTIKGPTVEISLTEYNSLKDMERQQWQNITHMEYQIRTLENELEKRADVKQQIEQAFTRIKNTRNVTESDTIKESKGG